MSRRPVVVSLVVLGVLTVVPAPIGAGGAGVRRDVIYESSSAKTATVTLVPLAEGRGGATLVKLVAQFRCEGEDVAGALLVSVGADGEFSEDTEVFTTDADIGSETHVRIAGRLGRDRASGTIDADVRAYDEEGTTFECERSLRWSAPASAEPELERIEAFARVGAADWIAAGGDAVYVAEDRGDSRDVIRRIDPDTGDVLWQRRVDAASDLAADRDALWIASGFVGRVEGFAKDDAAPLGAIDVADGFDAIRGSAPLAVGADAVWLALVPGRLVRLDPRTGALVGEVALGDGTGSDLSVSVGPTGVVVAIEEEPGQDADALPLRIVRVDPTTNQAVAEAHVTGQVTAVAAGPDVVTIGSFSDPIRRLDAISLELLATSELVASEVVALGELTWIATETSVVGLDATGARVVELPGVTGALATDGERLFVLDRDAGAVIGLSGAEPDE